MEMFRWLTDFASPRSLEAALRQTGEENSDFLMTDLIMSEIEDEIGKFETQEDLRKSQTSLQNNVPDYSWLAVNSSINRRRLLSQSERSKIESSAEMLSSDEWNQALLSWRERVKSARSRSAIIDAWSAGVREIVGRRPPPVQSVADQLVSYLRHRSSVSSQAQNGGQSPRDDDRASNVTELTNVSTIMPIDTQRSLISLTSSGPPSSRPSSARNASVAPLTSSDICDAV